MFDRPEKSSSKSMDPLFCTFTKNRIAHWNAIASNNSNSRLLGGYYHRYLKNLYRFHVQPGLRVLEIGCGNGELLASLEPSYGVGIDFSPEMISKARKDYPYLRFLETDAHSVQLDEIFDVIILSDLVNDLWDVQSTLEKLKPFTAPHTRILLNFFSHLWAEPLKCASSAGLMRPLLPQNWLTVEDMINLLELSGYQTIKQSDEILVPLPLPFFSVFCNRWLARCLPFKYANLAHLIIARPQPPGNFHGNKPTVSVIVAARNEEGNIVNILNRVPQMGGGTELIFVEGGSSDDTYNTIQREIINYPELSPKLFQQPGKGKGDAVRTGFIEASGDILMILDADLTVPPEDLPRFYDAIATGKGEFINGVRLVYPMEDKAMRFLNLIGNKFFSIAFSWLLGQHIKDTLCGTKVLWKKDYQKIAANRSYFGDFDPFGDFDLLFGAAKLNLKHIEIPVRYRERTYGETNISRFSHGLLLLKMVFFAARKIKFYEI